MKTVLVLLTILLLTACTPLPTMQYCEKVEYKRDGSHITVRAECQAPVGAPISIPVPGV